MKFKVRVFCEWVEDVRRVDAACMCDYEYAPGYPPKSMWKELLRDYIVKKGCGPVDPDCVTKITITEIKAPALTGAKPPNL